MKAWMAARENPMSPQNFTTTRRLGSSFSHRIPGPISYDAARKPTAARARALLRMKRAKCSHPTSATR